MSLKRYLEISTHKDFRQMMKNAGLEPNTGTASGDTEFLDAKKKFYSSTTNANVNFDKILKNQIYHGGARICLCHNGNFFMCSSTIANHSLLAKMAYFDYQFPELRDNLLDLDDDVFEPWAWWTDISILGSFVCLTYNPNVSKDNIYLSESYDNEDDVLEFLTENYSILNHYTQLIKQKFNKEFVPEVIYTY